MYNYHILTSMNKTDIYEKLLDATMNSMSYEIVEDYIYHLKMYNFQKIKNANFEDIMYLCSKADLARGKKGQKLRKAVSWLLDEEY